MQIRNKIWSIFTSILNIYPWTNGTEIISNVKNTSWLNAGHNFSRPFRLILYSGHIKIDIIRCLLSKFWIDTNHFGRRVPIFGGIQMVQGIPTKSNTFQRLKHIGKHDHWMLSMQIIKHNFLFGRQFSNNRNRRTTAGLILWFVVVMLLSFDIQGRNVFWCHRLTVKLNMKKKTDNTACDTILHYVWILKNHTLNRIFRQRKTQITNVNECNFYVFITTFQKTKMFLAIQSCIVFGKSPTKSKTIYRVFCRRWTRICYA